MSARGRGRRARPQSAGAPGLEARAPTSSTLALTLAASALLHPYGAAAQVTAAAPLVCREEAGPDRIPLDWRVDFVSSESDLVVEDGLVHIGAADGTLRAYDACSGELAWAFDASGGGSGVDGLGTLVHTTPIVTDGTVIVAAIDSVVGNEGAPPSTRANVFAVSAESGDLLWSFAAPEGVRRTPMVEDGLVFVQSRRGVVHALDAGEGTLRWTFGDHARTDDASIWRRGAAPSLVAKADDLMVVRTWPSAARGDTLYALDAADGARRWSTEVPSMRIGPLLSDEKVVVASGRTPGNVVAVGLEDGGVAWRYQPEGARDFERLIAEADVVYLAANRDVIALDASTGTPRWIASLPGFVLDLDLAGDAELVAVAGGTVYVIDRTTGDDRALPNDIGAIAVLLAEDGLAVIAAGAPLPGLHGIAFGTGERLWRFEPGDGHISTGRPTLAGGRLFIRTVIFAFGRAVRVVGGHLYSLDARRGR